jgi:hypothetical protein
MILDQRFRRSDCFFSGINHAGTTVDTLSQKCPQCGRDIKPVDQEKSPWPHSTAYAYKCTCGKEFIYAVFDEQKAPPKSKAE